MGIELTGKRVIAIGERDGVHAQSLSKCAEAAGATLLLQQTHCFVWTAAGGVDLEGQEELIRTVEVNGREDVIVLLGTPTPESTEVYAQTVKNGDPSWAGALAGVALNLSAYHILEPEIKALIPEDVYEREVGFSELTLDAESIVATARRVRAQDG